MSDKRNDFPRDLRGLCGGLVEDTDGSYRELFYPVKAYANLWELRKEMERNIADPDTRVEDLPSMGEDLEAVKKELVELKRRILDHFAPRPRDSSPKDNNPFPITIDHDAKSKIEKALNDVEAGQYDCSRQSMTLQAVIQALAFAQRNGRMPSQREIKGLKALNGLNFNDQQAQDAGKWLAMQSDPESNEDSLFQPLLREQRGPKKK